jgi:hypothetical protein
MKMKYYEIKRTVVEYYYVEASTKKEALEIIGNEGGPASITVKSEIIKVQKSK